MKQLGALSSLSERFARLTFLLFISTALFSCIPTKKVVYIENSEMEEAKQSYTPEKFDYTIKPGDRFFIQIIDPLANTSIGISEKISAEPNNQANIILQSPNIQDYLVNDQGNIDFPLIGDIHAEGKTISELRAYIKEQSKGYISNPSIKLYMTNYNITVLGEVNNPSFVQVITNAPTFFDAIGLANDLTDFADRKRVKIIRKVGDQVEVALVDVTDPNFISSPYYYLYPNDVIHVMPLKVKKFSTDNALPMILSAITVIITIVSISSR